VKNVLGGFCKLGAHAQALGLDGEVDNGNAGIKKAGLSRKKKKGKERLIKGVEKKKQSCATCQLQRPPASVASIDRGKRKTKRRKWGKGAAESG